MRWMECEGDWLVDWRNETWSWFQRWGAAKRNERTSSSRWGLSKTTSLWLTALSANHLRVSSVARRVHQDGHVHATSDDTLATRRSCSCGCSSRASTYTTSSSPRFSRPTSTMPSSTLPAGVSMSVCLSVRLSVPLYNGVRTGLHIFPVNAVLINSAILWIEWAASDSETY